jgi:hypothetical protein
VPGIGKFYTVRPPIHRKFDDKKLFTAVGSAHRTFADQSNLIAFTLSPRFGCGGEPQASGELIGNRFG